MASTRPPSTCPSARPRTRCRRSTSRSRPRPTSRSAATPSADGWQAWPRPSRRRRYLALVCFSYPLHPPGSPERTDARIAHWPAIRCPVLLLSGESDPFARIDLLRRNVATLPRRRAGHLSTAGTHAQAGPRRCPRSDRGIPARSAWALTRTRSAGPEPRRAERSLASARSFVRVVPARFASYPDAPPRLGAASESPGPPHRRPGRRPAPTPQGRRERS